MFITVINDCHSGNEVGRQGTRLASLLGSAITFVEVSSDFRTESTYEAAGNLVDVLDAAEDREGIVLLNVAPRGDVKKDGHNGTPFCYFRYQKVWVISTVKGYSLSLVKKLGLVDEISLMSVEEVTAWAVGRGLLAPRLEAYISSSQFRSFDFTPRVAHWLWEGKRVPGKKTGIDFVPDIPNCIWYVDAFGNGKTTWLASEVSVKPGERVRTNVGEFGFYRRLKDLPKGETGVYIGSSGIGDQRLLEIATQQVAGSAAKTLGIKLGDVVSIE